MEMNPFSAIQTKPLDSINSLLRSFKIRVPILFLNLDISLSDVLLLLESCDDSSAADADELTSFLLHQCAKILCAPVFELFLWIVKTQYWPDLCRLYYLT